MQPILLHVSIGKSSHMITYCIASNVSWLFKRFELGCYKRGWTFFSPLVQFAGIVMDLDGAEILAKTGMSSS